MLERAIEHQPENYSLASTLLMLSGRREAEVPKKKKKGKRPKLLAANNQTDGRPPIVPESAIHPPQLGLRSKKHRRATSDKVAAAEPSMRHKMKKLNARNAEPVAIAAPTTARNVNDVGLPVHAIHSPESRAEQPPHQHLVHKGELPKGPKTPCPRASSQATAAASIQVRTPSEPRFTCDAVTTFVGMQETKG